MELGTYEAARRQHAITSSPSIRGDSTFNQQPIEVLLVELAAIAERYPDGPFQAGSEFVSYARGSVHTYVKFAGD